MVQWTGNPILSVGWLIQNVWPKIMEHIPNSELHLAGKNMPDWLINGVTKIIKCQKVDDAVGFMNDMDIMLVPLLSAGGIRVKIIEGMALAKPISTSIGAEGIEHNENLKIANNEDGYSASLIIDE